MKLGEIDKAYELVCTYRFLLDRLTLVEQGAMRLTLGTEALDTFYIAKIKEPLRREFSKQLGETINELRALGVTID